MRKGKFITVDGVEGAGKSTQIDLICRYLHEKGIEVVRTREPGGTEVGEKIRSVLLDVDNQEMHSDTELMLMFSSRNELIQNKIIPALNEGYWVVSDRFTDASFAYQGGGRMLDLNRISELADWVLGDFKPDLTLLLDVSVEVGMQRIEARSAKDRIELEERASILCMPTSTLTSNKRVKSGLKSPRTQSANSEIRFKSSILPPP
jgi:dTMP kinase